MLKIFKIRTEDIWIAFDQPLIPHKIDTLSKERKRKHSRKHVIKEQGL